MIQVYLDKTFDIEKIKNVLNVCEEDFLKEQFGKKHQTLPIEISHSTGDHFYDEWLLDDRFKGTELETLWNNLDSPGHARIILQSPGACYMAHCDIDNRYHINLFGNDCYLIDLEKLKMYHTQADGLVYSFDAGIKHTAANFSNQYRAQLVITRRLSYNKLDDPVNVLCVLENNKDYYNVRYPHDLKMLKYINKGIENKVINDFKGDIIRSLKDDYVECNGDTDTFSYGFEIERNNISELEKIAKSLPIKITYDVDYKKFTLSTKAT